MGICEPKHCDLEKSARLCIFGDITKTQAKAKAIAADVSRQYRSMALRVVTKRRAERAHENDQLIHAGYSKAEIESCSDDQRKCSAKFLARGLTKAQVDDLFKYTSSRFTPAHPIAEGFDVTVPMAWEVECRKTTMPEREAR